MTGFTHQRAGRRVFIPGVLVLVSALGFWLPACSAQDKPAKGKAEAAAKSTSGSELARVNGQVITEADVREKAKDSFTQMQREYEQQERALLESTLEQMIQDRLIEAEAKARNTTADALLAEAKGGDVTDAEVDAFYEQNKARIPPTTTKEQIAPQIKQYLGQQRQAEARDKLVKELQAKYSVDYLIEPVRATVAKAGYNVPAKGGAANAPVTIVEFSDFECPYCSRVNPTLAQVMSTYGDKVRIEFRQFPLNFHPNAQKAAEASLCAHDQGKFWELHDAMFADQKALAVDAIKAKAKELGLNAEQFNTCLDSGKHAAAVQADLQAGAQAGVSGTPAMFINGRFINGAVPFEQIAKVIDDELKRKGVQTASKSK
ncbi:MAG TPA: thioredoxin domain-containing protein [Thermoanaerobaculia bacterium]|nr:thioredoxin domain-containing protein [Thermoanaerobaculia bacterium]